jgi:hypothetical protein
MSQLKKERNRPTTQTLRCSVRRESSTVYGHWRTNANDELLRRHFKPHVKVAIVVGTLQPLDILPLYNLFTRRSVGRSVYLFWFAVLTWTRWQHTYSILVSPYLSRKRPRPATATAKSDSTRRRVLSTSLITQQTSIVKCHTTQGQTTTPKQGTSYHQNKMLSMVNFVYNNQPPFTPATYSSTSTTIFLAHCRKQLKDTFSFSSVAIWHWNMLYKTSRAVVIPYTVNFKRNKNTARNCSHTVAFPVYHTISILASRRYSIICQVL